MGMDLIEIVVRTENAFGIQIPDAVAAQITTPRELANFVATKVSLSNETSCLSQQSFYFLRENFQSQISFSRQEFRPNALLENLIPNQNRRLIWAQLQSAIGENAIPDLARPFWLFSILAAATVFVFGCTAFTVWTNFGGFGLTLIFSFTSAIAFAYFLSILSLPTKNRFRKNYQYIGEIAKYLAVNKPHVFKRKKRTWTKAQIMETVCLIVEDYIDPKDFSDDAHFIKDLHLD